MCYDVVIIQIVLIILILGSIIGISNSFSEEIESEFGEYYSTGNVWMEITHSVAEPPPWILWKGSFQSNPPDFFGKITSDLELSKIFFDQFNIELKDLVSSNKNAELCEALGCLSGTYHLLVSEEDGEKFQVMDYNYMISKTIPPKKQQDMPIFDDKIICKPNLDLIFKSTDNSPACVKPESIPKLIERGWAKEFNPDNKFLCELGDGVWHEGICNYVSKEYCTKLNGIYDDCPDRCGKDPNEFCRHVCESWCIVEK